MKRSHLGMIFTIDVDGKPTVAFEVKNLREAAELSREEWFRADLSTLSSNGEPLCKIGSKLKARLATAPERDVYGEAAQQTTESDDILLAYLVELVVRQIK